MTDPKKLLDLVTPIQALDDVLQFSDSGALIHLFALQAVVEYALSIKSIPLSVIRESMQDSMSQGEAERLSIAWKAMAREVVSKVKEHLPDLPLELSANPNRQKGRDE